jgi:hypothetical protein
MHIPPERALHQVRVEPPRCESQGEFAPVRARMPTANVEQGQLLSRGSRKRAAEGSTERRTLDGRYAATNPRCLVRGSSRRIKDCEVRLHRPTLEYQPGHRRQARLQPFVSCFIHDNERRSNASTRLLTGRSISASRSARRGVAPRCAVIRSEGRALWPVSALARGYARECSVSRARPTTRLRAGRRASLRRPARRRENAPLLGSASQ